MKSLLLIILLVVGGWGGFTRIRDRNAAVEQGAAAYARRDYVVAAAAYQKAVTELGAKDEATVLNLAHACARAGRDNAARTYYSRLLTSQTPAVRSVAQQQLAVLTAQKGEFAQAIGLLREALRTTPDNAAARYNYEVLRDYLARRPNAPRIPPPAPAANKPSPDPQNVANQPRSRPDNDGRRGQLDEPNLPPNPQNAPQSRPDAAGQPDVNQAGTSPGATARGGFQPGTGAERNVARGSTPGDVRGISDTDTGEEITDGRSNRAGTEQAALNETQLQTQRARLRQMQFSPGQARQILESLGAAEQQYLQQLPRRSARKPATDKPAW